MNITDLAVYAGWGLLALFVLTIMVLVFLLLRDRDTSNDKKDTEKVKQEKADRKAAKDFIKQKATTNGISVKRAKKDIKVENSGGLLTTASVKPSAFSVEGVHTAEEINTGLPGERTTNPFRDRETDDELVPAPVPPQFNRAEPVITPPVLNTPVKPDTPVAPEVAAPAPVSGLPAAPQRPQGLVSSKPSSNKVAAPPTLSGGLPSRFGTNKEQ